MIITSSSIHPVIPTHEFWFAPIRSGWDMVTSSSDWVFDYRFSRINILNWNMSFSYEESGLHFSNGRTRGDYSAYNRAAERVW